LADTCALSMFKRSASHRFLRDLPSDDTLALLFGQGLIMARPPMQLAQLQRCACSSKIVEQVTSDGQ